MKEKRQIAEDLDYIQKVSPSEFEEIANLIKYTKKMTEMRKAKKEGELKC